MVNLSSISLPILIELLFKHVLLRVVVGLLKDIATRIERLLLLFPSPFDLAFFLLILWIARLIPIFWNRWHWKRSEIPFILILFVISISNHRFYNFILLLNILLGWHCCFSCFSRGRRFFLNHSGLKIVYVSIERDDRSLWVCIKGADMRCVLFYGLVTAILNINT